LNPNSRQILFIYDRLDSSISSLDRTSPVGVPTPDTSPSNLRSKLVPDPSNIQTPVNGMPSPMDECDNIVNIDPPQLPDTTLLKRKLDESLEELSLPSKKVAVLITSNSGIEDAFATGVAPPQAKLTKAERDALRLEKSKEREMERKRRDLARQQKEEEKLKREEERLKKVHVMCIKLTRSKRKNVR
jgi:hypothetical protein